MWRLRKLLRKIKAFLFIYRIGPLSRQYHQIKDPAERHYFAAENFGKDFPTVMDEHHFFLMAQVEDAFNREE